MFFSWEWSSIYRQEILTVTGGGPGDDLEIIHLWLYVSGKLIKYNIISKIISQIFNIGSNKIDDDYEFFPAYKVDHYSCDVFRLAFDLRKSSHYKVVQAGGEAEGFNRELKHCKLNMEDHDHPIMTSLKIAHGLHRGRNFLESFGGPINDPILLLMELPHMLHLEGKFFESCGCLLLVCRDDSGSTEFTIYEMTKGSSMWSIRYLVNIVQLLNPLPEGWSIRTCVWSICLGEGKEDAFVVINLSGKVVKYNLISQTNTKIFDIGSNQMDDDDDDAVMFISPFEVDLILYEFISFLASM
nr:hypothetical protein [Tanacetum cinerariifolium]